MSIQITNRSTSAGSPGSVNIPNGTDWAAYTPTFAGLGTVSGIECEWRQVLDAYEIRGKFVTGTVTGSMASISLPNAATSASTSKIPSIALCGKLGRNDGTQQYTDIPVLMSPSTTTITFGGSTSGGTASNQSLLVSQNGNSVFGNAETESFFCSVPIAGLSANTSYLINSIIPATTISQVSLYQSNALGTAAGNTTFVYANVRINTGSDISYIPDAVNGDSFRINTTGIYAITANIGNQSGGTNGLTINNSPTLAFSSSPLTNILNTAQVINPAEGGGCSYTGMLTVGDVVRVQSSSSSDVINGSPPQNIFTITKVETASAAIIPAPSPFQFFSSSAVTTQSSALTATSFTTFSNSPAFTFTPTASGTYKVYSPINVQVPGAGAGTMTVRAFNTSGGASLLSESRADFFSQTAQTSDINGFIQSVYTLVSGTSYVFDIQGISPSGSGIILGSGTANQQFYMFAERVQ